MLNMSNLKSISSSTLLSISSLIKDIQISELLFAFSIFIIIHSIRISRRHALSVWPVIGMSPSIIVGLRSNAYEWLTDVLCCTNMTFRFKGPAFSSLNSVITADPLNIEHMLKTRFPNFPKGDNFRAILGDLLGDGIFNADHGTWHEQHKTASLVFHSAKFRQLTAESLDELVNGRLMPLLVDHVVDLQDVLCRFTFDSVCKIALGIDSGCLKRGQPEIPFARAVEKAIELLAFRFLVPTCVWKAMRGLNIGAEKELKESIHVIKEFVEKIIKTRKEELENDNTFERSDLLSVFMRMKQDNGEPFSEIYLRDICFNFIMAGRDTTSIAMCWFFWLVDRHKEVEEKIFAEICRIIRERESEEISDNVVFKAEEIKKMEYLHAAVSESLRLYPSVPFDLKEAVEDDVLPDGTELKKGTKVLYAIYSMGRMESIWGEDSREYKPERWLSDGKFRSESAYKFTAFNGGPRLCIGKDYAYYQMKFVAASIMYKYRVKVVENHPVEPKLSLALYMKHGLKVHMVDRNRQN